ncbi:VCP-like ATPase [uncultured archaeon]|nr:VCP-like ATPase [uncultured archaeon]
MATYNLRDSDREGNRESRENEQLKRRVILLEGEINRLKELALPPYIPGTVLETGNKTARVVQDNKEVYEVSLHPKLKGKVRRGTRIVLHSQTKAIINYSEFKTVSGEVYFVEENVGDRLKIRNSKGDFSVILSSLEGLKSGDEIMLDPSGSIALEKLPRRKSKYTLEKVDDSPWEKVQGLEDTIQKIRFEIEFPYVHKEIFEKHKRKPAKGILLSGPPGCGKTLIARTIAYNLNSEARTKGKPYENFLCINGPEIFDKFLGNSEGNIRLMFRTAGEVAAQSEYPVIILFDEADSVFKTRGTGVSTDIYDSIVPTLLTEMDGLVAHKNIIVILATNREDVIDPAVLRDGRIDKKIKVPRPNKHGAKNIFKLYLDGMDFDKNLINGNSIDSIADYLTNAIYEDETPIYEVRNPSSGEILGSFGRKHLMSGALIRGLVNRADQYSIEREINGGKEGITKGDFERALYEGFLENSGFSQMLVLDDWEDVFGSEGKDYQKSCNNGIFTLVNSYQIKNSLNKSVSKSEEV